LWDNDGNGKFTEKANDRGLPGPGASVNCATVGDVDNDGDLDLVSGGVFLNNGNGSFGPNQATQLGIISEGRGGMAFDADGDGDLDIILNRSDRDAPYIRYYVNQLSASGPLTNYLKVKLIGPQGQEGAPGTKISIYMDVDSFSREKSCGPLPRSRLLSKNGCYPSILFNLFLKTQECRTVKVNFVTRNQTVTQFHDVYSNTLYHF